MIQCLEVSFECYHSLQKNHGLTKKIPYTQFEWLCRLKTFAKHKCDTSEEILLQYTYGQDNWVVKNVLSPSKGTYLPTLDGIH